VTSPGFSRRATVILESPAELATLLASVPGVSRVVPIGTPPPPCDVQASLLDLPARFGTTVESIPAAVPYLTPAADRVDAWQKLLAEDPPGKRVGLVWSGNPRHTNDPRRSIPLRSFEPLAALQNVTFFSLQKGPAQARDAALIRQHGLIDAASHCHDFADTAAVMSLLDLVITTDTAPAHLAGALAKPTWVMLEYHPEWRWMRDRGDNPWYPTLRLFRQPSVGDWTSVVVALRDALATG